MGVRGSRFGAGLAVAGGTLAVFGVLLPWGQALATFEGGALFGEPIPAYLSSVIPAEAYSFSFTGSSQWIGWVAGAGGVAALGMAGVALFGSGRSRRWTAFAFVGGAVAVAAAVQGAMDTEGLARTALMAPVRDEIAGFGLGIGLGPLAGLVDRVLEEIAKLFAVDAQPGLGLAVTGVGGLLALSGGAVGLTGGRPTRATRVRAALGRFTPETRRELLVALSAEPEARALLASQARGDPERRWLAELLDGVAEDERSRASITAALRELERASP
jgi:hypothetical protein